MTTSYKTLPDRRLLGIGLSLSALVMFTGIDSSAKWLGLMGLPALQVVFIRYAGQLALVSAVGLPRHGAGLLKTSSLLLQVLRALVLLGSTTCNFIALQYLPLTVTGAIMFTMPLMLSALSVPLLGERVGWRRWSAIAVGFIGILIIVRPGTEAFHPAALLNLLAAFFTALYLLLTRRMAGSDSASTQQFYGAVFAAALLVPFALPNWTWPGEASSWFAFFMIGVFGFLGHQLTTLAHTFAPASVLAPFSYLQIIFLAASSWVIFNEPPDIWLYIGGPIVIGSGLFIWRRERQLARSQRFEAQPGR